MDRQEAVNRVCAKLPKEGLVLDSVVYAIVGEVVSRVVQVCANRLSPKTIQVPSPLDRLKLKALIWQSSPNHRAYRKHRRAVHAALLAAGREASTQELQALFGPATLPPPEIATSDLPGDE